MDSRTGGNSIPLGFRRRARGEEELEVRSGDGVGESEGVAGGEGEEEEEGEEGREKRLREAQEAALRRLGVEPAPTAHSERTEENNTRAPPSSHTVPAPVDRAAGNRREGSMDREEATYDWKALRKGIRDEDGDVAFYDGSFIEDPWAGLLGGREG